MRERTMATVVSAGLLLLTAAACGSNDEKTPQAASPPAGAAGDEVVPEVEVPTQEEAEAEAAETIDESNADEEFEKLKKEIEGEG